MTARPVACAAGSPPRMWGTPGLSPLNYPDLRFTPTHVGNTETSISLNAVQTVHPHACGEHSTGRQKSGALAGSPPRMWGTRRLPDGHNSADRFTPTHVGNTRLVPPCKASCTVHPHACGEHAAPKLPSPLLYGSPPRMWGTPSTDFYHPQASRFTPTHVGNTLFL